MLKDYDIDILFTAMVRVCFDYIISKVFVSATTFYMVPKNLSNILVIKCFFVVMSCQNPRNNLDETHKAYDALFLSSCYAHECVCAGACKSITY